MQAACGDDDGEPGFTTPYEGIPATETITAAGLSAPVDVVRDEYGVPHIYAKTRDDLAFANGYIMAHDRLPQMNLFRHAAEGRVAELFGALEPGQIDSDIQIRLHKLKPLAEQSFMEMQASTDPTDAQIVAYFTRFADGVNAYQDDLKAGKYTLDDAVATFFPVDTLEPWTPVDSLAIGRLQTYALSYDEFDLRITRTLQEARTKFDPASADPALAARAGTGFDVMQIRPNRPVSPIDGFPNVDEDSGSRAKPDPHAAQSIRPWIDSHVLDAAIRNAKPSRIAGIDLSRGPMMASNNWIVGPTAAGGNTILANDTHLPLINPSIWWMVHLTIPGELDVEGVSFPGLPAVQLGHNQHLAWGATVVVHDVYDFYAEDIAPCTDGQGDCTTRTDGEHKLTTRSEEIKIGANGTIIDSLTITFEEVPGHGPIIPEIQDHDIVPRTGNQAITVKFTGHEVTHEPRAVFKLMTANTIADGMNALDDWNHGGMNWILADDQGHIAYTASARIPRRSPGCYTFHKTSNPDGVAPYMVQPGDGSCEWTGFMDARYMPHAIDPAKGYLATANADPVGETFDGDPLNGPMVDGTPLYIGSLYDPGFRVGRIYDRLDAIAASGNPATVDDMKSIQADTFSSLGDRMQAPIAAAMTELAEEIATPGTHPDLETFVAALSPAKRTRLQDAGARLAAWTLETPPAVEGTPSAAEIADSSATTIFNAWAVVFLQAAYGDELAQVGEYMEYNLIARVGLTLFEHPTDLLSGLDATTGEPVLCDDLGTPALESCTLLVLRSLDTALDWATGEFGTADADQWRWGRLHTLTLASQLPSADLDVPPPDEPNPLWQGGYPRHGDTYSVDSSDGGYTDFDFSYGHGPAMRHITVFAPGQPPKTFFALPGGLVFDRSSPHYRDLADTYYMVNEYFELPWLTETIIDKAEERWRFRP